MSNSTTRHQTPEIGGDALQTIHRFLAARRSLIPTALPTHEPGGIIHCSLDTASLTEAGIQERGKKGLCVIKSTRRSVGVKGSAGGRGFVQGLVSWGALIWGERLRKRLRSQRAAGDCEAQQVVPPTRGRDPAPNSPQRSGAREEVFGCHRGSGMGLFGCPPRRGLFGCCPGGAL